MTGSFLAAILAGINPANTAKPKLIRISNNAATGLNLATVAISAKCSITRLIGIISSKLTVTPTKPDQDF